MTLGLVEILRAGGLGTGGMNFDAKLRRQSIDRTDLFHGHIGGMGIMARALLAADAILVVAELDANRSARYAAWDGELGSSIRDGTTTWRRCTNGPSTVASRRTRRAGRSGGEPRGPLRRAGALSGAGGRHGPRRRRRLVDQSDQGRGARARERAVVGRGIGPAPADAPAAVRAGSGGVVAGIRAAWRRPARRGRGDQRRRPAARHGGVDEQRRVIRPAKLWNDTESAPDAAG